MMVFKRGYSADYVSCAAVQTRINLVSGGGCVVLDSKILECLFNLRQIATQIHRNCHPGKELSACV